MRDTRICAYPGDTEHDHAMCQDVIAEEATRYTSHWHVVLHSEDDDRLSTYDFVEALDYAAAEVDRMGDHAFEQISFCGDSGNFEAAYRAFQRFGVLEGHALNLRNMVEQATGGPARRAPHYRDEPARGPLWTVAAERVAGEVNAEIGNGFAFYRCVCGDCRPGAWIILENGGEKATTYSAAEFFRASAAYRDLVTTWAEDSDNAYALLSEDEGDGTDQGSDVAAAESMLADPVPNSTTGHNMRIHANDGSTVTFSLSFDPESFPTEV